MGQKRQRVIGLTGGIASGKSTVTAYLRRKGFLVIDADEMVRTLQKPEEPLFLAIKKEFGEGFFDEQGHLERKALSNLIFRDKSARERLSNLQDAVIRRHLLEAIDEARQGGDFLVFVDIPLLFEKNYQSKFDEIWLVEATREQQIERLRTRNKLSTEEAEDRISAQLPLEEKKRLSNLTLKNTGTLKELYAQIDEALSLKIQK